MSILIYLSLGLLTSLLFPPYFFLPLGFIIFPSLCFLLDSNKKNYSIGEVKNYLSLSKERVTPSCMYYQQCGGCQLQHMAYEHQLEMKQKRVSDALKHIAKLYVPVDDIIKSKSPFEYRNKIQMAFANSTTGLIAGFYQAKTKKVLNIN